METSSLFEGEEILLSSDDKTITLTNKRLRQNESSTGRAHITSIHLEKISSIEIHYKSWVLILILGILLAIGGSLLLTQGESELSTGAYILGGIFVLIYFITRRHLITVASGGGAKINMIAKGMKRENVLDFVNRIENAKSLIK